MQFLITYYLNNKPSIRNNEIEAFFKNERFKGKKLFQNSVIINSGFKDVSELKYLIEFSSTFDSKDEYFISVIAKDNYRFGTGDQKYNFDVYDYVPTLNNKYLFYFELNQNDPSFRKRTIELEKFLISFKNFDYQWEGQKILETTWILKNKSRNEIHSKFIFENLAREPYKFDREQYKKYYCLEPEDKIAISELSEDNILVKEGKITSTIDYFF